MNSDLQQISDQASITLHEVERTIAGASQLNKETLDTIQGQLYGAYDQAAKAGDSATASTIESAWIEVQRLHQNAVSAVDAAQSIADLARELQTQRNQIAEEYDGLRDAVETSDQSHPLVADLYQEAFNEGCDSAFEEFDGWHVECPGCAVTESGHLPHIDHHAVNALIHALMGSYGELTDELTRKLTTFVNEFADELEADNLRSVDDE